MSCHNCCHNPHWKPDGRHGMLSNVGPNHASSTLRNLLRENGGPLQALIQTGVPARFHAITAAITHIGGHMGYTAGSTMLVPTISSMRTPICLQMASQTE